MNVLFLSQRLPDPPDRGDRITTHHMLRHLLACGARVRVGCLSEDERDLALAKTFATKVQAVCAPRIHRRIRRVTALRGLFTGHPLTLPYFRHPTLAATVSRWLREDPPDLIYVYSSSMAQYVLGHSGAIRVMQFAELDSDKWKQYAARCRGLSRWIYNREARLLLEFERRVARAFDLSLVVSPVERELFVERIPEVTPTVLPNGVDVDHFASQGDTNRDPHTVVFTGVMDYEPNVDGVLWFHAECWPAIRAEFADARLQIVGNRPAPAITALDGKDGITVTGRVPTTPPYFDSAAVAIAPLRLARGVQNKVLEAMSMGLPVVCSGPAAQGLGAVPPDTLVTANDAATTTAAVIALLRDPERARVIGRRANQYVREHYRWERMFEILDAALEACRPQPSKTNTTG